MYGKSESTGKHKKIALLQREGSCLLYTSFGCVVYNEIRIEVLKLFCIFGWVQLQECLAEACRELVKKMEKSGAKAYLVNTGWNLSLIHISMCIRDRSMPISAPPSLNNAHPRQ